MYFKASWSIIDRGKKIELLLEEKKFFLEVTVIKHLKKSYQKWVFIRYMRL